MNIGEEVELVGSNILWEIVDIDKFTVDLVDCVTGVMELHGVSKDDIIIDIEE